MLLGVAPRSRAGFSQVRRQHPPLQLLKLKKGEIRGKVILCLAGERVLSQIGTWERRRVLCHVNSRLLPYIMSHVTCQAIMSHFLIQNVTCDLLPWHFSYNFHVKCCYPGCQRLSSRLSNFKAPRVVFSCQASHDLHVSKVNEGGAFLDISVPYYQKLQMKIC